MTGLAPDVAAALAAVGLDAEGAEAEPITRMRVGDRQTLRVRLRDGTTVKARRFLREQSAARFLAASRGLQAPLARLLGGAGRVTVEEWVEGVPLNELPLTPARLEAAADLLARVHAARARSRRPVAPLRLTIRRQLAWLASAGALDPRAAAAAIARLATAPRRAPVGLVHGDLCAENLVEDRAGRLLAVDNELLRAGFLDLDLARAWARWPMPDPDWRRFAARYGRDDPPAPFWRIAALVLGAFVRVKLAGERGEAALFRLRDLVAA